MPFYGGSSFHLGNTFTALTALLLDGVSGGLAGAIGLALADILAGDPGYAVTTFVLKFIIGITCGAVAHKVFKLRELDRHSSGYLVKVIVSAGSGLFLNVLTDPFLGYFRNVYIFGQEYTVAQALTKIAGGITFVNSVASTVSGSGTRRSAAQGQKLSDLSILIQHCCPRLPDFSYPPAGGGSGASACRACCAGTKKWTALAFVCTAAL